MTAPWWTPPKHHPQLAGRVLAETEGTRILPLELRKRETREWLHAMKIVAPDDALEVLSVAGSGAEARFAWECARQPGTLAVRPRSFVLGPITLELQVPVRMYRADFIARRGSFQLAIEIDGMGFHHQSVDQVEADYVRQRRFALAGYSVVRFSAREALTQPAECWRQVVAILEANDRG